MKRKMIMLGSIGATMLIVLASFGTVSAGEVDKEKLVYEMKEKLDINDDKFHSTFILQLLTLIAGLLTLPGTILVVLGCIIYAATHPI